MEKALHVVPYWPTQSWFPRIMDHQQQGASLTMDHRQASSFAKAETFGMPIYRDLWSTPMSATVEDLLEKSRRPGTRTKYESVQKKWVRYCQEKGYHCREADTTIFLNFIGVEFDRGMKYSTIRGYISALQPFMKIVDLVIVSKVMKGVFNTPPPPFLPPPPPQSKIYVYMGCGCPAKTPRGPGYHQ